MDDERKLLLDEKRKIDEERQQIALQWKNLEDVKKNQPTVQNTQSEKGNSY